MENADLVSPRDELGGESLETSAFAPTKIYVKPMLSLMDNVSVVPSYHRRRFFEHSRSLPAGVFGEIEKKR